MVTVRWLKTKRLVLPGEETPQSMLNVISRCMCIFCLSQDQIVQIHENILD